MRISIFRLGPSLAFALFILLQACNSNSSQSTKNARYILHYEMTKGAETGNEAPMLDSTVKILKRRLAQLEGVTTSDVKPNPANYSVEVEIKGSFDNMEIHKALTMPAHLEINELYSLKELMPYLKDASKVFAGILTERDKAKGINSSYQKYDYTLLKILFPNGMTPAMSSMPQVGLVELRDTAHVNYALNLKEIKNALPPGVRLYWMSQTVTIGGKVLLPLYAIKEPENQNEFIENKDIARVKKVYNNNDQEFEVYLYMNVPATENWKKITEKAAGNYVGISIDDKVYMAPRILGQIKLGMANIAGLPSEKEANFLANILGKGELPLKLTIVKEEIH